MSLQHIFNQQLSITRRMNHQEIRFRILHTLYQKYYGGQPTDHLNIDTVIRESELGVDADVAFAEIIYLRNSGHIDGIGTLGKAYSLHIKITNYGIDAVESIAERALNSLAESTNSSVQSKINEIREEKNPNSRTRKSVDYIKEHPDFVASTFDRIIRTVIDITGRGPS